MFILLTSSIASWAGTPTGLVESRTGWIQVSPHSGEYGMRRAVLRNPGKRTVSVSLSDGKPTITYLSRAGEGWTRATPMDCGVGMTERQLASGDSIVFDVWPQHRPGDGRFRLAIPVTEPIAKASFYASSSAVDFRSP